MGWKTIKGRRYFYRSRRVGGRVVSDYMGPAGGAGDLAAWMTEYENAERVADRTEEREQREADTAADQALDDLVARVRADAAGVLVAAGYHQHKRGAWRRRRRSSMARKADAAVPVPVSPSPVASSPDPPDWTPFVNIMDVLVQEVVVGRVDGDNADIQKKLGDELDEAARDLAGKCPTPIEGTLAMTAALAWFALRHAEATAMSRADRTITQATFDLKRVEHANRRYLSVLRTLAQVRKLARPGVQVVNVGENNQTNILACADPTDATHLAG